MLRTALVLALAAALCAAESAIDHRSPGNAAAAAAGNRAALLALLARPGPVLLGQNTGHGDAVEAGYRSHFAEAAAGLGGRVPLICGADYGWDRIEADGVRRANEVLIAHWRRGGLVQVSMHPTNPSTQAGVRSPAGIDIEAVLRRGTEANRRWMADLAVVADGLSELRKAGVAVMWRPLHEANGPWFWWGEGAISVKQYRRLWEHLHGYLTKERGLDNLVWIWSPNARTGDEIAAPAERYPGAALVDAVAMDIYTDSDAPGSLDPQGSYAALAALGKPFGIGEFGPAKRRGSFDAVAAAAALRAQCPKARWCLWWHSWGGGGLFSGRQRMAIADNPRGSELLADPAFAALPWSEQGR